jgi:hypothetical protein
MRQSCRPLDVVAWVVASALLGAARDARTAESLRLSLVGPVPFSAEEIDRAVAARVSVIEGAGPAAAEGRVCVVGPADGAGVHVRLGDKIVLVEVGVNRRARG